MMYTIYLEPILDKCSKEYKNVLTIDKMPTGPLSALVTQVNTQKLSAFKSQYSHSFCNCKYVLHKIDSGFYMDEDDVTNLISFSAENGYKIDMDITKLLLKTNITKDNKKIICVISDAIKL